MKFSVSGILIHLNVDPKINADCLYQLCLDCFQTGRRTL